MNDSLNALELPGRANIDIDGTRYRYGKKGETRQGVYFLLSVLWQARDLSGFGLIRQLKLFLNHTKYFKLKGVNLSLHFMFYQHF